MKPKITIVDDNDPRVLAQKARTLTDWEGIDDETFLEFLEEHYEGEGILTSTPLERELFARFGALLKYVHEMEAEEA
jgi:hypothetical protein